MGTYRFVCSYREVKETEEIKIDTHHDERERVGDCWLEKELLE